MTQIQPAARSGIAVLACLFIAALAFGGPAGCGSGGAKKMANTDVSARTELPDSLRRIEPAADSTARPAVQDVSSHYMDRQAKELAAINDAKTERVDNTIRMTWDSDVLFGFDSAMLKTDAQESIEHVAEILKKYPDTRIIVCGHTDSEGDEDYNFTLSERRALSVRNYLLDAGVPPERIQTVGFGEFRPLAPNNTEQGRRLNRRVEIEIHPNETLNIHAADADTTG